MFNTFIVKTENFVAANIVRRALKAYKAENSENETAARLYAKACIGATGGKLVISNIDEMRIWRDAIKNYKPMNTTEGKVYRVLAARAVRGYDKRLDGVAALCREN